MDFTQSYNRSTWINFLEQSFLPDDFEIKEEPVSFTGAFSKSVARLGTCPSLQLSVFEVKHSSLNDARVGLSKEAFNLVRDYTNHNRALVLFVPQTSNEKYRFSYVEYTPKVNEKGKVTREISNPRRFSYILGKDAKVKTPQQYLQKKELVKDSTELKKRFSIEVLTEEFYKELFKWYEWAKTLVEFPNGKGGSQAKKTKENNELHLIRLITRLIFVWFMKQSKLIPEWIFDEDEKLTTILSNFSPNSEDKGTYYNGILQNLFFGTLNREIFDAKGGAYRQFTDYDEKAVNSDYAISNKYRDNKGKSFFKETHAEIIKRFEKVPFLNGGLFDCLDSYEADGKNKNHGTKYYYDGFSREEKRRAFVPDCLFWGKNEKNEGIIHILKRYNFTIEENTPTDIEVALDPELLGKVFENLLGYLDNDTHEMARKASGSFYTPREIVNYMADESLITHIKTKIPALNEEEIRSLFSDYSYNDNMVINAHKAAIIECLKNTKILDPACGSGAFPMGILNRMVDVLQKLENITTREEIYKLKLYLIENCIYGIDKQPIAVQIAKLRFFISLVCEQEKNDKIKENYGIKPLPNLETKFVAANTLIGLSEDSKDTLDLNDEKLIIMKNDLWDNRIKHFYAKSSDEKKELQRKDEKIRKKIMDYLIDKGSKPDKNRIIQMENGIKALQKERLLVAHEYFVDETESQSDFDFGIEQLPKGLYQVDINKVKRDNIDREIDKITIDIEKEKNKGQNIDNFMATIKELASWDPYDQNKSSPFFNSVWMFGIDKGFDVVIGNPPYVQLQSNRGELANIYSKAGYECFSRSGDIYQLFYENGYYLLADNGHLCFITSNKWMRAAYGEKTRSFLGTKTNPRLLIDFAGQRVFETATVDVNIILIQKAKNQQNTQSCIIKEKCENNMTDYIKQHGNSISFPIKGQSWIILSNIENRIKEKIEKIGKPLKDWDINIYRGILTGCNEAFIIDKHKRDELIKKDKKSAEIIRPILRGRDIKRYGYEFAEQYIIATFPSKKYDIDKYPAVRDYLLEYGKKRLEQSGKPGARKKTRHKWFETQDTINYWDDFSKRKILWAETMRIHKYDITNFPRFGFTKNDVYTDKTCFFATGNYLYYIMVYLNSSIGRYLCKRYVSILDNGGYLMQKIYLEQIPIIKPTIDKIQEIEHICNRGIEGQITNFELITNKKIYTLFNFSNKEIEYIENDNLEALSR